MTDPLDDAHPETCPHCGTVMRENDGGYECGWDGTRIEIPRVERPTGGDNLPSIG